jgi:hypothetical protein
VYARTVHIMLCVGEREREREREREILQCKSYLLYACCVHTIAELFHVRVGCVTKLLMPESEILTRIWPHKLVNVMSRKPTRAPTNQPTGAMALHHDIILCIHCMR